VGDGSRRAPVLKESEDLFKLEYEAVNTYILHYSNVRSALSSFLITVALASFAAYYGASDGTQSPSPTVATSSGDEPYLLAFAGYLFLVAAVFSSLRFSYLTERASEYSVQLWRWAVRGERDYPGGFRSKAWEPSDEIWAEVRGDPMNKLLIGGAVVLALAFPAFELLT
jgi:hypothetical protein